MRSILRTRSRVFTEVVRELGHEIETAKDAMFEIKGVSADLMAAFSTRSAEIDAALGERGTSREDRVPHQHRIVGLWLYSHFKP